MWASARYISSNIIRAGHQCEFGNAAQFDGGKQRVLPGSSRSNSHATEAAREEVRVGLRLSTKPNDPNHLNFTSAFILGHNIALSFQNATTGWCSGMPRCTRFERTDPTITSRSHSQHTPPSPGHPSVVAQRNRSIP